jgi:hypothetical protein
VTGWWKLPSIFQSYELGYTYVNLCRYVANIIFFGGIAYFVVIVIKTIIVLHLILRGSKAGSSTLHSFNRMKLSLPDHWHDV